MRTLIVGDVHGCLDELKDIVDSFGLVLGKDRIFQTGDMINRGPHSLGSLEFARECGIQSVLGNHESRLIQIWETPSHARNPKEDAFLKRLGGNLEHIYELVKNWPLWIDDRDFTLVHAGIQPGKSSLEDMDRKVLLTVRTWDGVGKDLDSPKDPPWFSCVKWPRTVVFGHWALGGLVVQPGFRGLDSGCVYGKSLSAWCPEEDRIYQVAARHEYSRLH